MVWFRVGTPAQLNVVGMVWLRGARSGHNKLTWPARKGLCGASRAARHNLFDKRRDGVARPLQVPGADKGRPGATSRREGCVGSLACCGAPLEGSRHLPLAPHCATATCDTPRIPPSERPRPGRRSTFYILNFEYNDRRNKIIPNQDQAKYPTILFSVALSTQVGMVHYRNISVTDSYREHSYHHREHSYHHRS